LKLKTENQKIVVLDANSHIHDLVTSYFHPKGYHVECYFDHKSLKEEFLKSGINWGVLIVDLDYLKNTGAEFVPPFKRNKPALSIIATTAHKDGDLELEAIMDGNFDFAVQPFHFPQLQLLVDRALRQKTGLENHSDSNKGAKRSQNDSVSVIGKSPEFLEALELARRVAPSTASILLTGESGTGKEVFAKFIHQESARCQGPFVAINCSAIPESLLESELFGHSKGAFTGAFGQKIGLFEEAENGTLFLDEIGDLSLALQAKLLRVLQEKQIKRIGENRTRSINCRLVSATHKDLSVEVKNLRFREDLYFRLDVIPISIPPLRERKEDLIPLAESFLSRYAKLNNAPARSFSIEAIEFLFANQWRGNVRELENTIERAVVLCPDAVVSIAHFLPASIGLSSARVKEKAFEIDKMFCVPFESELPQLEDVIGRYIEYAVKTRGGARDKTAQEIGIDRKTLYKRLKVHQNYAS